ALGCGLDVTGFERVLPLIGRRESKNRTGAASAARKALKIALITLIDLLYMIVFTLAAVIFIYHFLYGIVRWYAVAGAALGFVLYVRTVGHLTARAAGVIIFIVGAAKRYAVYFSLLPLKMMGRMLRGAYIKTVPPTAAKISLKHSRRLETRYFERKMKIKLKGLLTEVPSENGEKRDV
ncbi:MAG: spore cortex biosynthesis protein YabQ, partial [Firmicutes bacterium]|nr:spore cortex biosynthesis protein YabQ [Bacillota bacterium]